MQARISDDQLERMILLAKSESERDYFLISLLGRRGLRIGTIVGEHSKHRQRNKAGELVTYTVDLPGIKKRDLRPDQIGIRVYEKGGVERVIRIPPKLFGELVDWSKHFRPDDRLVQLSERHANTLVKRYAIAAEVEGNVHTHRFRHHFGTEMARKTGRDPWKVADLMGHHDLRATKVYVEKLTPEEEAEYLS